jgi:hypothetical protein
LETYIHTSLNLERVSPFFALRSSLNPALLSTGFLPCPAFNTSPTMPVVDLSTLPPLERAEKSLLFQPLTLGSMTVKHRIALAPLTRNRGKPSSTVKGTWYPWQIQEDYYVQRATDGGMLISEAFPVSLQAAGKGMVNVPGIWTQEQKDAWKPIVKNVKKAGAVFVAQRESRVPRRNQPVGVVADVASV